MGKSLDEPKIVYDNGKMLIEFLKDVLINIERKIELDSNFANAMSIHAMIEQYIYGYLTSIENIVINVPKIDLGYDFLITDSNKNEEVFLEIKVTLNNSRIRQVFFSKKKRLEAKSKSNEILNGLIAVFIVNREKLIIERVEIEEWKQE